MQSERLKPFVEITELQLKRSKFKKNKVKDILLTNCIEVSRWFWIFYNSRHLYLTCRYLYVPPHGSPPNTELTASSWHSVLPLHLSFMICWSDSLYCSWPHADTYPGPAYRSSRLVCWFSPRFRRLFFHFSLHKEQEPEASLRENKKRIRRKRKKEETLARKKILYCYVPPTSFALYQEARSLFLVTKRTRYKISLSTRTWRGEVNTLSQNGRHYGVLLISLKFPLVASL